MPRITKADKRTVAKAKPAKAEKALPVVHPGIPFGGTSTHAKPADAQVVALTKKLANKDATIEDLTEQITKLRSAFRIEPGYENLQAILTEALNQASLGKGKERHANDLPFGSQPMQVIAGLLHGPEGILYQAIKKATEANSMRKRAVRQGTWDTDRAKWERELLGSIVYIAGAIVYGRAEE